MTWGGGGGGGGKAFTGVEETYGSRKLKIPTTVTFRAVLVCKPQTSQIGSANKRISMKTLNAVMASHDATFKTQSARDFESTRENVGTNIV